MEMTTLVTLPKAFTKQRYDVFDDDIKVYEQYKRDGHDAKIAHAIFAATADDEISVGCCQCGATYHHDFMHGPQFAENKLLDWLEKHLDKHRAKKPIDT